MAFRRSATRRAPGGTKPRPARTAPDSRAAPGQNGADQRHGRRRPARRGAPASYPARAVEWHPPTQPPGTAPRPPGSACRRSTSRTNRSSSAPTAPADDAPSRSRSSSRCGWVRRRRNAIPSRASVVPPGPQGRRQQAGQVIDRELVARSTTVASYVVRAGHAGDDRTPVGPMQLGALRTRAAERRAGRAHGGPLRGRRPARGGTRRCGHTGRGISISQQRGTGSGDPVHRSAAGEVDAAQPLPSAAVDPPTQGTMGQAQTPWARGAAPRWWSADRGRAARREIACHHDAPNLRKAARELSTGARRARPRVSETDAQVPILSPEPGGVEGSGWFRGRRISARRAP